MHSVFESGRPGPPETGRTCSQSGEPVCLLPSGGSCPVRRRRSFGACGHSRNKPECPSRYQRNSAPADSGPEVRSLQESTACPSLAQDLFQKIERAWIMALTKPENCLFADSRVFVGFRDVDQQRDSLAVMNL